MKQQTIKIYECWKSGWNGLPYIWVDASPACNYDIYEIELPEGFTADEERGLIFRDGDPYGRDIRDCFFEGKEKLIWQTYTKEVFDVHPMKLNETAKYI